MRSRRARTVSLVLALTAPTWLAAHTAQAPAKAPQKRLSKTSAVDRLLTGRRAPLVPRSAIDWTRIKVPVPTDGRTRPNRNRARFPIEGAFGYGDAAARFGNNRGDHMHEGQDVFAPAGTPLVAVLDAVVVESGSDGGRGNYVALYSPRTRQTYMYLHMQAPALVPVGSRARAGQRVGSVGCTGSCFGDHLHFEIRKGRGTTGTPVDPLPGLQRWSTAPAAR